MIEKLQGLILDGKFTEARRLSDQLYESGEQSETYWILNAELYRIEGQREAEHACITRGLQKNACNYELYYMLGEYYRSVNIDQAYLCMEQAEYYCNQAGDLDMIRAAKNEIVQSGKCQIHPVSIVILSYNIKDIMAGCIESIRSTCPKESYELVVVDNASTDGVTDWLKEQKDIVLQCNAENKGFAGGCNQGIRMSAASNDIMLLNNDTVVPPNAIFWLRMGLYERETVGAVGPLTNYAGNDQQVLGEYKTKEEYLELAEQVCLPNPNAYEHKVWLVGFAMLIKRSAVDRVGGLDTRYTWGNYEDNDYGMMLTKAGYELLLCYNSFIYHYGSLNMAKDKQKYLAYIRENGKKLEKKWGFDAERYNQVKHEYLKEITENHRDLMKVLHIGCGWGATLARIRYLYPNAKVYGIEETETIASLGKYLAKIKAGHAEELITSYPKHYFDYIFVEQENIQIRNVQKFQLKLRKILRGTGKIVGEIELAKDEAFMTSPEVYKETVSDHREEIQSYLDRIDRCLENKTAASIKEFLYIMQEKDLLENFLWCIPEIAYAHIFSVITIKEVQKRADVCYLLNGNSIKELIRVLKRVEFRIWELEFDKTPEAEQHLYETMQQYYITPEAMSCIIAVAALDKCDVCITLSCIYLEHQEVESAIALLEYSLEGYPEDAGILQALSGLYRKTGKTELAEKCKEKLK